MRESDPSTAADHPDEPESSAAGQPADAVAAGDDELNDADLEGAAGGVAMDYTASRTTSKVGLLLPAVQSVREYRSTASKDSEPVAPV